jgi:hypothetical protein
MIVGKRSEKRRRDAAVSSYLTLDGEEYDVRVR